LHSTTTEASGSNTYKTFNISLDADGCENKDLQTYYLNATLDGLLTSWAQTGLPGFYTGTYTPASNVPGNYTIRAAGPSSFKLLSKDTGCMFT
jgi:hypothetical protein